MDNFILHTNTPSSSISIQGQIMIIDSKLLLNYEDYELFSDLCKSGCPNYNKKWSCPPFSPTFNAHFSQYKNAVIFLMYANLNQYQYIKSDYLKVKASNVTLKTTCESILRTLEPVFQGIALTNGSCRHCKPCNCKLSLPCKKPVKRRYSMEAVGLNVDKISNELFSHPLLWYKKNNLPEYTSVVSCLLTNKEVDISYLKLFISNNSSNLQFL